MKFTKGNIPLYFQFYLQLKQDIITGDLPPGTRLPSIEGLYEQHELSQGTVRKALELLEKEGLIFKKQRLGTVVEEQIDFQMWAPGSSIDEIKEHLDTERFLHIDSGWIKIPKRVSSAFGNQTSILKNDRIFEIQYLAISKENERKKVFSQLYVPYWVTKIVSIRKIKKAPVKSLLLNNGDLKISGYKQILRPWLCDAESAEYLEIPEGTPIFHRTWIPNLSDGRILYYLENLSPVFALERYISLT